MLAGGGVGVERERWGGRERQRGEGGREEERERERERGGGGEGGGRTGKVENECVVAGFDQKQISRHDAISLLVVDTDHTQHNSMRNHRAYKEPCSSTVQSPNPCPLNDGLGRSVSPHTPPVLQSEQGRAR